MASLVVALVAAMVPAGAGAALLAVGPLAADGSVITDPTTGIPGFYEDANHLKLMPCDDGKPACAGLTQAEFTAPDGEEFYNRGVADIDPADLPPGAKVKLVLATEAAFAGADPDFPITFTRIRTTINGLPEGTYTITEPFGTQTVDVTSVNGVTKGVTTDQVGCAVLVGPCDWAAALDLGRAGGFGPFVTWAPNAADPLDVPPAGYVGDALTPHAIAPISVDPVTGLPQDFFKVEGPHGFSAQTNLFTVTGKLATIPVPVFSASGGGFGTQRVNTSVTRTITVKNNGLATMPAFDSVAIGAGRFSKGADGCTGASLAPGRTCTVDVAYRPTAVGPDSATLTLTEAGTPHDVALTGTGGVPGVSTSPASVNFLNQAVGSTSGTQAVTVTNTGPVTLTISNAALSGVSGGEFAIASNSCGATLAPGASCTIGLKFLPGAAGTRSGTLVLSSDAPGSPTSVPLTGTGTSSAQNPPANTTSATTVLAPAAPTGPVVAGIKAASPTLGSVVVSHTITARRLRRQGLRLSMSLGATTRTVRIAVYRIKGGRRSGRPVYTAVRTPDATRRYVTTLTARAVRGLRPGLYEVAATPVAGSRVLGSTTRVRFRVVR